MIMYTSGAVDVQHNTRIQSISGGMAVLGLSLISLLLATWKHLGPSKDMTVTRSWEGWQKEVHTWFHDDRRGHDLTVCS
jgi:hypothetical protein